MYSAYGPDTEGFVDSIQTILISKVDHALEDQLSNILGIV